MGWWDRVVGRFFGPAGAGSAAGPSADQPAVAALDAPPEPAPEPAEQPAEQNASAWWLVEGATLREPAAVKRPDLSAEAIALEELLVSHFDGHDLEIPTLPHVPQRVLSRLRSRDCTVADLAREISEDQVVAAAVLRTCNSPMFRGLEKITALTPAVARLGSRALQTLMMHQSLRAAMFHSKSGDNDLANILWTRSLAAAVVMHELAPLTTVEREDAFLIGLLHDIGNVMVLRLVRTHERMAGTRIDLEAFEYLCHECHQEFGELIARAWKLPGVLASLIAGHHDRPHPGDPLATERWLVQLADMIIALLGYAPHAPYDLLNSLPAGELGLANDAAFAATLPQLPARVEHLLATL